MYPDVDIPDTIMVSPTANNVLELPYTIVAFDDVYEAPITDKRIESYKTPDEPAVMTVKPTSLPEPVNTFEFILNVDDVDEPVTDL